MDLRGPSRRILHLMGLKGNPRKGIEPVAWEIPEEHDVTDHDEAFKLANSGGVPLGLLYKDDTRDPLETRVEKLRAKSKPTTVQGLVDAVTI